MKRLDLLFLNERCCPFSSSIFFAKSLINCNLQFFFRKKEEGGGLDLPVPNGNFPILYSVFACINHHFPDFHPSAIKDVRKRHINLSSHLFILGAMANLLQETSLSVAPNSSKLLLELVSHSLQLAIWPVACAHPSVFHRSRTRARISFP